ncbi:MAG: hypothetical protein LYZ69_09390 [Nitrososphaerales archaeon]|nr:hypothetical protein [Nitrososphaerales archaeon]
MQIERDGNGHTDTSDRLIRGVKTDRVYRILLCDVEGTLTGYRLAKLAQTEQTHVSLIIRDLEKSSLVRGTRVTDHKGLLARWSRLHVKYQSQSYMLPDVLRVLKNTGLEYGLTTYRAESMVNRYLFPSKTELYIRGADFEAWHALLVKEGALVGGGNVRLRWYDDQVLYNSFSIDGYRMVSVPQLIVDLLREVGSAVEAANMMMQKYAELLTLNRLHSVSPFPVGTYKTKVGRRVSR